jgi:hypothetical protein
MRLARLRTEEGVCLTCSSHRSGGNRDIHPFQTTFDIRAVGPSGFLAFFSPTLFVLVLLWNRLVQFLSHSLQPARTSRTRHSFWLDHSRSTHLIYIFRFCIIRCVSISFISAAGISFHCPWLLFNVYCALFPVFCPLLPFKLSLIHCVIQLRHHDALAVHISVEISTRILETDTHTIRRFLRQTPNTVSSQFYNSRISNRIAGLSI